MQKIKMDIEHHASIIADSIEDHPDFKFPKAYIKNYALLCIREGVKKMLLVAGIELIQDSPKQD